LALQEQIAIDGIRSISLNSDDGTSDVFFLSAEAVITVKLMVFRPKDRADIYNLVKNSTIEWDYLDILFDILKTNWTKNYDDGYGEVSAFDWWPDVVAQYKKSNNKYNK
jgi:hypothetical protein